MYLTDTYLESETFEVQYALGLFLKLSRVITNLNFEDHFQYIKDYVTRSKQLNTSSDRICSNSTMFKYESLVMVSCKLLKKNLITIEDLDQIISSYLLISVHYKQAKELIITNLGNQINRGYAIDINNNVEIYEVDHINEFTEYFPKSISFEA